MDEDCAIVYRILLHETNKGIVHPSIHFLSWISKSETFRDSGEKNILTQFCHLLFVIGYYNRVIRTQDQGGQSHFNYDVDE